MRLYQLFDHVTRFEFTLRYYCGREYLALDKDELLDKLEFYDFERDNRCYPAVFLNDKLLQLKQILLYLKEFTIEASAGFEGEYTHYNLFLELQTEFYKKGIHITVECFNRRTLILYHLSQDIICTIDDRIQLVTALSDSNDYAIKKKPEERIYILNDYWRRTLERKKEEKKGQEELDYKEWELLKLNKYKEISQLTNYEDFFTKEKLEKFKSFKDKIDLGWSKPKMVMLFRMMNLKGYFRTNLKNDQMVRFAELYTRKSYTIRNFQDEAANYKKWLEDYGGFKL